MLQLIADQNLDLSQDKQVQTFAVEFSSQHISCSKCCTDKISLNVPTFIFSNNEGVNKFTFPPVTGWEMGALALFFKAVGNISRTIVFDHIAGFKVLSSTNEEEVVTLEFSADSKLLNFMGINDSLSNLITTLHANQLEELAESILDSAAICK